MSGVSSNSTIASGYTVVVYANGEAGGVGFIAFSAGVSVIAAAGLFIALLVSRFRRKALQSKDALFVQSNMGSYFMSLLVADMIASISSFMSVRWAAEQRITPGGFCTTQGAIKNIGNIAVSLWMLVISMHVFNILFLRVAPKKHVWIAVTVCVWALTGVIAIAGPTTVANHTNAAPYFGPAGYWCWITEEYEGARIGAEFFWMFFSGAMSFVLYSLVFLRLRGNLTVDGWKLGFMFVPKAKAWKLQLNRDQVDNNMLGVARLMMYYPILFTVLLIPIAIGRFVENSGGSVPFGFIVFAASLFTLAGFMHVVIFVLMRRKLPSATLLPTFNIKRKKPASASIIIPNEKMQGLPAISSARSDESFEATREITPVGPSPPHQHQRGNFDLEAVQEVEEPSPFMGGRRPEMVESRYDSHLSIVSTTDSHGDHVRGFVPQLSAAAAKGPSSKRVAPPAYRDSVASVGTLPSDIDLVIPQRPAAALVVVNGTSQDSVPTVSTRPSSYSRYSSTASSIHSPSANPFSDPSANPFADASTPHPGFEDDEDEYDGMGEGRRGRRRSTWQPSLSAYFQDVDISTPKGGTFTSGHGRSTSEVPPVPNFPVGRVAPRDVQDRI